MGMYPRLSQIPLSAIKATLNLISPEFRNLTGEEKLKVINAAQQQVSAYRNKLNKLDYLVNTIDVTIPIIGNETSYPFVKFVYANQTLKEVTDLIPDDGMHYVIYFYHGASIGVNYVHRSRFHIVWIGQSSANLNFQAANFSDIGDAFNGANVIGSNFTNCNFGSLTLEKFKERIFLYDKETTIWIDGTPFGD